MTTQGNQHSRGSALPYKYAILIAVTPALMVFIIDSTVVNVALAKLSAVFAVDLSTVQWTVSAFALAVGVVTPTASYFERRFTLKRVWIVVLSIFTGASIVCGLAPTFWVLVMARLLQGLSGGILGPLALSSIFRAFPEGERGAATGLLIIPLVAGPAFGPSLGGYIVTYLDWRFIFFVNLPLGVAAILLAAVLLRDDVPDPHLHLDVIGALLSSVALGSLLYGLSQVSTYGWGSAMVRTLLAVGVVGLAALVVYELFQDEPLIELRLFQQPQFAIANLVGGISTLALFGAEFLFPLYLQELRGMSALQSGLILLPQGLAIAFAGPVAGRLYDRVGARPLVLFGLVLLAVNTWQLTHLTLTTSLSSLGWLLVTRGIALGFVRQPTQLVALSAAPDRLQTNATSLLTVVLSTFQSLGVALLSTVAQTQSVVHATQLSWQVSAYSAQGGFLRQLTGTLQLAGMTADGARQAATQLLLSQLSLQGSMLGFADAYAVTFGLTLLAFVAAFALPSRKAPQAGAPELLAG